VKKLILAAAMTAMPLMTVSAQDDSLKTEEDKLSYSLGVMIGERVLKNYGDTLNYEVLMEAMQAQHSGAEPKMTLEAAQETLASFEQKRMEERQAQAVAAGKEFLEANAARDEVTAVFTTSVL